MATDGSPPTVNGTSVQPAVKPLQLVIALPNNPTTTVHLHLTVQPRTIILHATNSSAESGAPGCSLGSFVYALPDRYNPAQPLSTPLYTATSSLDFTTRLAKVLVKKTEKACYVSWSGDLRDSAMGGSVEEEMAAFRAIVAAVVDTAG